MTAFLWAVGICCALDVAGRLCILGGFAPMNEPTRGMHACNVVINGALLAWAVVLLVTR